MSHILTIVTIVLCADFVLGMATLNMPSSAYWCNRSVLMCTSTDCNLGYRFLKDDVEIYTHTGPKNGADPARYSATVTSNSQVQLTIMNIQLADSGAYVCQCGFEDTSASKPMPYACMATTSDATITNEKKLSITVESLYPQPSKVVTSLGSLSSLLPGNYTCVLTSHYRCTWLSTASLADGNHSYTITLTLGTQTAALIGHFMIVTPTSPNISNLVTISPNRQVIRGIQDTPLSIHCASRGGIPTPTLAWYRGNSSTTPLAQSATSDGTDQVTLTHTFTPNRTDDMKQFLCRVFYPGATTGASPDPSPATALLFLDLKPDNVTVSQIGEAVSGRSMTLRCTSTNSRPAPSITWLYQAQNITPTNTSTLVTTTETYSLVSVLQRPVSAVDNGHTVTCRVSHKTLTEALNKTVIVDVKFGPFNGSTAISGNLPTQATGVSQIRLNCTSGSSNPASNISWYNGSDVISTVGSYRTWSGQNNGVITSKILTITPTRYMDGDRITCRSDNSYGNDSKYVDLDILYSPLIQPLLNLTSTEGEQDVSLTCSASSKPPATFTWNRGNMVVASGMGTITDNSFSYTMRRVDRADAGSYQCKAANKVGNSSLKNMYLFVKYPATVNVSTTTSPFYTVTCTAEGYPDSYTYQDWVQIWPGYGPVATIPFNGTTLTLTDATYEISGVYVCGASNGIAVYGKDVTFMKGNATVIFKAPPVFTDPSSDDSILTVAGRLGRDVVTKIRYWSPADSSVKCYKHMGGSRSNSSSCIVTEMDTEVTLPVHNHMVKETGTLATITIHISSQNDMTRYDVVVSNNPTGESVKGIIIVPEGPPQEPTLKGNFSTAPGQVILTVLPGFHGGYNQTLVVQISTDLNTWSNNTYVDVGQEDRILNIVLRNLQGSTLHYVRVFAYSILGESNNFSTVLNFTTDPTTMYHLPANPALIGGAVGTTCALLVVAVVLIVVWKKRKAMISKKGDRRALAMDQDKTGSVVECAMYVSTGNVQQRTLKGDVSTPQKKGRTDSSANVYAVVSKTRRDLPETPRLAETNFNNTKTPTSNRPLPIPKQNVSGDGLIYAELEFDTNSKYDVIHGLDDVTIYVEIDFTKTAEPLPESDEEFTEKKK